MVRVFVKRHFLRPTVGGHPRPRRSRRRALVLLPRRLRIQALHRLANAVPLVAAPGIVLDNWLLLLLHASIQKLLSVRRSLLLEVAAFS